MDIKLKDIIPLIGWFVIYQGDEEIDTYCGDYTDYKKYGDRKVVSIFGIDSSNFDIGVEIL